MYTNRKLSNKNRSINKMLNDNLDNFQHRSSGFKFYPYNFI